ncbi:MAG: hypothetical protein EBU90_20295, partial [Proteobacteria bacterium]|nr:hypothetical protein [Pseudomonadota bacterium]
QRVVRGFLGRRKASNKSQIIQNERKDLQEEMDFNAGLLSQLEREYIELPDKRVKQAHKLRKDINKLREELEQNELDYAPYTASYRYRSPLYNLTPEETKDYLEFKRSTRKPKPTIKPPPKPPKPQKIEEEELSTDLVPLGEKVPREYSVFFYKLPREPTKAESRYVDNIMNNYESRLAEKYRDDFLREVKITKDMDNDLKYELWSTWLNKKGIDPIEVRGNVLKQVIEGKKYITASGIKKARKIKGRGLSYTPHKKYSEFGKYVIHLPSLKKNIINLKYPSLASIPQIKQQLVNKDLRDFIEDALENGDINKVLYEKLKTEDKKLFNKLCKMAGIDDSLKLDRGYDSEDDEEVKRFELVKGELIAGNDAPEIIHEMKSLLLKFMSEGKIPKNQAHDLLVHITYLEKK